MADYGDYSSREFEDDLEDLDIIEQVLDSYRALAYSGEIGSSKSEKSSRTNYALNRLRGTFRFLITQRDNRY